MLRKMQNSAVAAIVMAVALFESRVAKGSEAAADALAEFQTKLAPGAQTDAERNPMRERVMQQLQQVEALVRSEDYVNAQRILQSNLAGFDIGPDLQGEWIALAKRLAKQLEQAQLEAVKTWSREVDELSKAAATACRDASQPADLDEVILRCTALQMGRERSDDLMSQVVTQQLSGTADFLQNWSKYLGFRRVNHATSANNLLRNLMQGNQPYPLLSREEIQSAMMPEEATGDDVDRVVGLVIREIDGVDAVPEAREKLRAMETDPIYRNKGSIQQALRTVDLLERARQAAEAGDGAEALKILETARQSSTFMGGSIDIVSAVKTRAIEVAVVRILPDAVREPDENAADFLDRVIAGVAERGDWKAMLALVELRDGDSPAGFAQMARTRQAIESYLAGQQFLEVGDYIPALNCFRAVVAAGSNPLVPGKEAAAAIERLKAENPDLVNNPDVALAQEMEQLRARINSLIMRPPGFR